MKKGTVLWSHTIYASRQMEVKDVEAFKKNVRKHVDRNGGQLVFFEDLKSFNKAKEKK